MKMKEIKFRGKAMLTAERMEELEIPHENRWVCGYLIDNYITGEVVDADDGFIAPEWWAKVDVETVGQYTGLKDKNGKEIYEGDTLQNRIGSNNIWIVRFEDGSFVLEQVGGHKAKGRRKHAQNFCCEDDIGLFQLEVIGNIHENPDLLEG